MLESFEMYPPGTAATTLKGSGTLLHDGFGNLKMDIRVDQASSDLVRAAGIDIRDGVISTDGRTTIDLQNRTLIYFFRDQSPLVRGPLSLNRPRHWDVSGDILTLTTKDEAGKTLSVGGGAEHHHNRHDRCGGEMAPQKLRSEALGSSAGPECSIPWMARYLEIPPRKSDAVLDRVDHDAQAMRQHRGTCARL